MTSSREKLLTQFRELVGERLGRINRSLMSLEAGPDLDAGKQTLRELHGLKGEARMMGFQDINSLVHQMEELLRVSQPRDFALSPSSVDALLVVSDAISVLAGATQGEAPALPSLLSWLSQSIAAEGGAPAAPVPPNSTPPNSTPPNSSPPSNAPRLDVAQKQWAGSEATAERPLQSARPRERTDATLRITQQNLEALTASTTNLQLRARQREDVEQRRLELARELVTLHRLAEDLGPQAQGLAARLGRAKELASDISRRSALLTTAELKDLSALSEEIAALRLLPVALLFEPYPRMVRELARELDKEVDLVLEGEEQRVDRSVLEALKDPVLHLVRNAVDHGFEPPNTRMARGKPARGTLTLRARRDGERLTVTVQDDGHGLDPEQLRQVAVRKGVLSPERAKTLDDAAAIELIFIAGFSSRDDVTEVSGRGVGLDAVRNQVLSVGGEVSVESSLNLGTTFELKVPVNLTLAPVLFVQVGDERLCLPASHVARALTIGAGDVRPVAGRPAVFVEGELVPFGAVASMLFGAPHRSPREGELVLLVRGRGQSAALAVDRVLDERTQAIFPLKGVLARFAYLTGATALPDGQLALLLSVPHLVASAHGRALEVLPARVSARQLQKKRLLVVDDSPLTRELLVALLESVGYAITQAHDGAQALELAAREPFDAVVTDLEMPNVDGLELTRKLKAHPSLRTLPVVIVTTRGSESDRRRGMEAGADGYVTKGDLVRQDLVDVVGRLLA